MSLRAVLAHNLSRLCRATGISVNQVCREMGVNRHQFEKYLQGEAIPNQATTSRICRYFGVDELDLYRIDGELPTRDSRPDHDRNGLLQLLTSPPAAPLEPGLYLTYFAIPGRTDVVIRSVTFIRRDGDRTTFRRLTGFSENADSRWRFARGDHHGVVSWRLNWFYFSGVERRATHVPSLLVVQWAPLALPILAGRAMVLTEIGPAATRVVLHRTRKPMALREALNTTRTYRIDDPIIDPLAARLLAGEGES